MNLQNMQAKDSSLVLSSDAKPRLKWTQELHQRFVDAVSQLGGPDKATPKSLMRVMGIHGLTLYHLKSHLQKYRLGKSQQSQTCSDNTEGAYVENQRNHLTGEFSDGNQNPIKESLQIAQALQMQMEVQRKLYVQIEVQRHLQLRIEAQGKYLQSVLKKAQDTLAEYGSSGVGVEHAKAELSQLVSMVDTGCPSSSFSVLTEIRGSKESSLTSSESSGRKQENQPKHELSLMKLNPGEKIGSNQVCGRKRSGSTSSDEQQSVKRSADDRELLGSLDLNIQCLNEFDWGTKAIDLNCKGLGQLNEHV